MSEVDILNRENVMRLYDREALNDLYGRIGSLKNYTGSADPDISVIIRGHGVNDGSVNLLLDDLSLQQYSGKSEIVVIDSNDGLWKASKEHPFLKDKKTVALFVEDDAYDPFDNLKRGIDQAQSRYIFSLFDKSRLMHRYVFKVATHYTTNNELFQFAGIVGSDQSVEEMDESCKYNRLISIIDKPSFFDRNKLRIVSSIGRKTELNHWLGGVVARDPAMSIFGPGSSMYVSCDV